jgi:hypothetical protein
MCHSQNQFSFSKAAACHRPPNSRNFPTEFFKEQGLTLQCTSVFPMATSVTQAYHGALRQIKVLMEESQQFVMLQLL